MRLPRLTLQMALVAVAGVVIVTWRVTDIYVKKPAQKHLLRLAGYHEIRQGAWAFFADHAQDSPDHQSTFEECRRIAAWHTQRIRELYSDGVPASETWWDEGQRMNDYEFDFQKNVGGSGLLRENYRAYRSP